MNPVNPFPFPFANGRYGPADTADFIPTIRDTLANLPEAHSVSADTVVAGSPVILEWCKSRGLDPDDVYGLTTLSWSETSKPWGVFVLRYKKPIRVSRLTSRLPYRFRRAARRIPVLVR